jgi:beta-phosphoglucomutase-like phosphatase (HAD superfamily)
MDGTLIDSEPYWIDAEMSLAARFGVRWTHEDGLTLVGNPLDVSAQVLIARGVRLTEAEVIDEMVTEVAARAANSMPWVPDARALLDEVVGAGIPCALVTMSIGSLVDRFVGQAGDVFAAVVTGDQVTKGKPDPEAYLLAAKRLGVDPAECVAIEDSPVGIRAAHASGAATIAVPRQTESPAIEGVTVFTTLEGVTLRDLGRILYEHTTMVS